jgi:hypothetical protein
MHPGGGEGWTSKVIQLSTWLSSYVTTYATIQFFEGGKIHTEGGTCA